MRCLKSLTTSRPVALLVVTLVAIVPAASNGLRAQSDPADSLPGLLRAKAVEPYWLQDGNRFWYAQGSPDDIEIVLVDPQANTVKPFFDVPRLRKALAELLGDEPAGDGVPFRSFDLHDEEQAAVFTTNRRVVSLDLASYEANFVAEDVAHTADPARPRVVTRAFPTTWRDVRELASPDFKWFASLQDHNLTLRNPVTNTLRRLTDEGEENQPWSLAEAKWSPDSRFVGAVQHDLRAVEMLPVTDWQSPMGKPYLRPWPTLDGPRTRYVGAVFDTRSNRRQTFEIPPETYVRTLGWRRDSSELLIALLSRDAQTVEIRAISADSGASRSVLVEKSQTFLYFSPNFVYREGPPFHFLNDNQHFVWGSERDGWNHFYLYRMDGKQVGQLTSGPHPVVQFGGVNWARNAAIFTARSDAERPYDVHVHRVSLDGGDPVRLSDAIGQHRIHVSPSGEFYVDKHSTTARPPKVELRRVDGSLVRVLSEVRLPHTIEQRFQPPEHFVAKAADGETDIYGVIFKPVDFDPQEKYPVVEEIYAGAFVIFTPYTFDAGTPWYGRQLPKRGYVHVVIDGRGTPGRSKEFQDVVYGNLGQHEIADHAAALKQAAATRPWMDMSRVGILGNSYGGYFAFRALLQAPDVYHAAVAAGLPHFDGDAVGIALECYLGMYDENRAAYEASSNLSLVDRLKGHLMLVKGGFDVNTPMHGTMKAAEALIRAGKHFDMLVIPGSNHVFRGADTNYRPYFTEAAIRHFDKYLRRGDSI